MQITLPDGSTRDLPDGATGRDLAEAISAGLARAALAVEVDGEVRDLDRPLPDGATVSILTWESEGGKAAFWHSSAHLMAEALEALYPGVRLGIGPAIETGFYYDVDLSRDRPPRPLGRRPPGDRDEDDRAGADRQRLRAPRRAQGRGRGPLRDQGRPVQAGAPGGPGGRRHHVLLAGRLHRPLPRATHRLDEADQGRQAPDPRRRLLARRRVAPAAHADLRRQLPQAEAAGGAPRAAGARPPARPPEAGPRARAVHVLRPGRAGPPDLAPEGRPPPRDARRLPQGGAGQARLRARRHAAHRAAGAVQDVAGTTRTTATRSSRPCSRRAARPAPPASAPRRRGSARAPRSPTRATPRARRRWWATTPPGTATASRATCSSR